MGSWLKFLPLALFLGVAGFLLKGLSLDPGELPSALIGKPSPQFTSARLPASAGEFDSQSMKGEVWVLNVWASWCGPCVEEHPYLKQLAAQRDVPLVGLNYKDDANNALSWLSQLGNPFTHLLDDNRGDVGLDWGVYGVPETFVIDRSGTVRYKHVGPVLAGDLEKYILPIIDQLQKEPLT